MNDYVDKWKTGARLQYYLYDKNWTVKEFAEKVGITIKAMQGYCDGKYLPNIHTLALMADVLQVPIDDIIVRIR